MVAAVVELAVALDEQARRRRAVHAQREPELRPHDDRRAGEPVARDADHREEVAVDPQVLAEDVRVAPARLPVGVAHDRRADLRAGCGFLR